MLRICPRCAKRLAGDLREKYEAVIEHVLQEQGWKVQRGWRMRHVTLTARYELAPESGEHVVELLNAARDAFHATWGECKGAGAVASIEVGEQGHKWHVHMLVWGPFVSHAELSEVWRRLTGCSVVWLRECGATLEEARGVAGEVLKYATKFVDLSPEMLVSLHVALKGRRRVRSWGSFYASGVEVEREPETCEVCGARMVLTPEWVIEARMRWLEAGGRLNLTVANKSSGRSPPRGLAPAPRWLGSGALCSQLPAGEYRAYAESRDAV
jgi:hypothetical protein